MSVVKSNKFREKKIQQIYNKLLDGCVNARNDIMANPLSHLEALAEKHISLIQLMESVEEALLGMDESLFDESHYSDYRTIAEKAYDRNKHALDLLAEYKKKGK